MSWLAGIAPLLDGRPVAQGVVAVIIVLVPFMIIGEARRG